MPRLAKYSRLRHELRVRAVLPAAAEEEHDDRALVGGLPVGGHEAVQREFALGGLLVDVLRGEHLRVGELGSLLRLARE